MLVSLVLIAMSLAEPTLKTVPGFSKLIQGSFFARMLLPIVGPELAKATQGIKLNAPALKLQTQGSRAREALSPPCSRTFSARTRPFARSSPMHEADRLPPAILLSGPPASGKLTAALELARVLSCDASLGETGPPQPGRRGTAPAPPARGTAPWSTPISPSSARAAFPRKYAAGLELLGRSPGPASAFFFARAARKLARRFDAFLYRGRGNAARQGRGRSCASSRSSSTPWRPSKPAQGEPRRGRGRSRRQGRGDLRQARGLRARRAARLHDPQHRVLGAPRAAWGRARPSSSRTRTGCRKPRATRCSRYSRSRPTASASSSTARGAAP